MQTYRQTIPPSGGSGDISKDRQSRELEISWRIELEISEMDLEISEIKLEISFNQNKC